MTVEDWLAEGFEQHRAHLRAVAQRMLGSAAEADDAVQEAWLKLSRAGADDVADLRAWLTTVTARVCLDMLRARTSRREETLDPEAHRPSAASDRTVDPEHEAIVADSVGLAMLVVLDRLTPAERVAFVLHDLFAVPFEEIGPILDRSATAARQLASRARRRVQGQSDTMAADTALRRDIVDAFLAASRGGDFTRLLAVLDPDVVVRADRTVAAMSRTAPAFPMRGADAVARLFAERRAGASRPAFVDGRPGLAWAQDGQTRLVFDFVIEDGKIVAIELIADPERLGGLEVVFDD